jgi:CheY-like chemotaxis protein
VHILVATDSGHLVDDVTAALGGPDVSFTICGEGRLVSDLVADGGTDLVVCDMQIGSKGGMAVTMDLRLDESAGRLPRVNVLLLLDRAPDIHLAKRCAADAYLVKPLDPLSIKRGAAAAIAAGEAATAEDPDPGAEPEPEEEPAEVG